MKPLVFFHGLEGSSKGHKATYLRKHYPGLVAPDLVEDLDQRLEVAKEAVKQPSWVVGSSWGALTALMLAQVCPQKVLGLVLLAPALGFFDPRRVPEKVLAQIRQLRLAPGIRCEVIGAAQDEEIDPKAIRTWVAQAPDPTLVHLEFVDDSHGLGQGLELIHQKIKTLMES